MPRFLTLKAAASRITDAYFPISFRTLEAEPTLPRRVINKRRVVTEEEADALAERKIAEANAKLVAMTIA